MNELSRAAVVRYGLFFALVAAVSYVLGDRYISRLSNHAGYFLTSVGDEVHALPLTPARRVVVVLIDGLRRDDAESLAVTREIAAHGQCRVSDQGTYTVSRPEYAQLSTGVEVDRSGARNNENISPLAAESVWQVARASGLRVVGSSHLPWFAELFPSGFDRFDADEHWERNDANVFARELADVSLFHPTYVDENSHLYGIRSPAGARAVARVDREVAGLLARIDWAKDTLIFTADHGHRDSGGHGGGQPEIRYVLTCFAGANVLHRDDRAAFDAKLFAPTLSVLMGVRFPRNMFASAEHGEDTLDDIWTIADAASLGEGYHTDRTRAAARFRHQSEVSLARFLGVSEEQSPTWAWLYEHERHAQWMRCLWVCGVSLVSLLAAMSRRPRTEYVRTISWLALYVGVTWVAHRVALGEFDFTVIVRRPYYVPRAFAAATVSWVIAAVVHWLLFRSAEKLAFGLMLLAAGWLVLGVGHVAVYGWPLGFPLPPPPVRYFPFFGSIAGLVSALASAAVVLVTSARSRRALIVPPR